MMVHLFDRSVRRVRSVRERKVHWYRSLRRLLHVEDRRLDPEKGRLLLIRVSLDSTMSLQDARGGNHVE